MFETTNQYIIFIMVGQTPNTSFHAPKCFGDLLYPIISPSIFVTYIYYTKRRTMAKLVYNWVISFYCDDIFG